MFTRVLHIMFDSRRPCVRVSSDQIHVALAILCAQAQTTVGLGNNNEVVLVTMPTGFCPGREPPFAYTYAVIFYLNCSDSFLDILNLP